MNNFGSAFKKVCELVEDFKQNEEKYLAPDYQEAHVRREFIDKFFEALGWDIFYKVQKNPYEREVKVETRVFVGKAQKRADYAFYIAPEFREPKFFAEAKKPSRNLRNAVDYFQTIRYGWNANTPVAVLTDFEELHILDCRIKPDIDSVLQNQNHKNYKYTDYSDLEKFNEIYYLISRDAVADNSLQKYSDNLPKPKGKATQWGLFRGVLKPIDEDFLEYIDEIRETLAKAFKKNDSSLTSEQLTEVTQRTVDRLVFIRFLEDKLIEPEFYISELGTKGNIWKEFITLCKKLDVKYNGIVFKDTFIDNQTFQGPEKNEFAKICEDISHLNSPYDFHYIPIHILGSIYERFLGKIVKLKGRGVKIEEKPEVRKAGGVYYTPKYIVDYIVENTVGKIIRNESDPDLSSQNTTTLSSTHATPVSSPHATPVSSPHVLSGDLALKNAKGKTPEEISKLRFADIACGSGSFLIGVYELLLEYHRNYYQNNHKEAKKDGCIEVNGIMTLSLKQKQDILLNNIYGVDIDSQAVEVTQLSLALKMLEDETTFSARQMEMEFHKKIIPEGLSKNIVCGNSLIGTDILSGNMFAGEEETKLNPMDFEKVFPHIFGNKNSRSVIPADFKPESTETYGFDAIVGNPPYGAELNEIMTKYFQSEYNLQNYQQDSTILFLERAILKLKKDGLLGYIIPNTWLQNLLSNKIRKYLFENTEILNIIHYKNKVFAQATVDTEVIVLKSHKPLINLIHVILANKEQILESYNINQNDWIKLNGNPVNILEKPEYKNISDKMKNFELLDNICNITQGCKPFQVGKGKPKQTRKIVDEKPYVYEKKIDKTSRPLLRGSNINRYLTLWDNNYFISFGDWLAEPRYSANYDSEKIIIRQTGDSLIATLDKDKFIVRDNLYTIVINTKEINLYYILGLINSKLLNWYYQNILNPEKGEALAQVKRGHIALLPINSIDFQIESEKHSHDLIVSLVDQMLESKKQLHSAKTDKDKTYYERKCDALDKQIDSEVYKLYGLTEEEIKIVEGKE